MNQNRGNTLVLRNVKKENRNGNITIDESLQNLSYVNYIFFKKDLDIFLNLETLTLCAL